MINDFALACAIDGSPAYFTYHKQTMLIIQSAQEAKAGTGSFQHIEPFIEVNNGNIAMPAAPGLGYRVDPAQLARYRVASQDFA